MSAPPMFTAVWSHSHRVQCGASAEAGASPENHPRACRYFSESNGSPPLPLKAPNTRLMSGRGAPQQGVILPVASITMFLYSQWQVWPRLGGESSPACSFPGFSYASKIAPLSTLSGNGFQFVDRFVKESQSKWRTPKTPAFNLAGRISASSQLTSKG